MFPNFILEHEGYQEYYVRLDESHFVMWSMLLTPKRKVFFFLQMLHWWLYSSCFDKVKQIVVIKHTTLASNKYYGEYDGKMLPALLEQNLTK